MKLMMGQLPISVLLFDISGDSVHFMLFICYLKNASLNYHWMQCPSLCSSHITRGMYKYE